mmetsp:Transcript_30402/g.34654  ORF Transcript_30402/g.34654 Transcript_30402/m.34654 type:complete len:155 (-) Transcript_30402:351-815(-)|eukprot:CAMPEP_0194158062 /NCGR_PEP_ID=MMETSP0152-20130528/74555_1 /TAXON_ID=1049557 /ORGANISM="Thalassiothrix antarctica, Strain L6-D1" /LENGTH=154 /DNA_ID=CAMNT_0038866989 /DNA_START=43 /DNA_END=507 /DNA_ORIENTATION=-
MTSFQSIDDDSISREELEAKIKEYSSFIDTKLYPELNFRVKARETVENEIAEYKDLSTRLESLPLSPIQTLVNLGYEALYCHAVTDSSRKIFVHVGMGFHVEMAIEEAIKFCKKRLSFLSTKLDRRAEAAAEVARHVETSLHILEELSKEKQNL